VAIVDELVTLLSLEGDDNNERVANQLKQGLDGIEKVAKRAGIVLTGVTVAIGAWTKSLADSLDETGKFAASVRFGFEELQEFEFAIQRNGGTISEFRSDVEKLSSSMASPIPGEFNQVLFLLGVAARDAQGNLRSTENVLVDLAAKFSQFDQIEAQQFGQRLGLSQSTIRLLQQGRFSLEELRQEARALGGIMPAEAAERAAQFNDQLTNIQFAMKGITQTAGIALLPVLTEVVQRTNQFFLANREIITSGLQTFVRGVITGFSNFINIVNRLITAVGDLLSPLEGVIGNFDAVDGIATIVTATLVGLTGIASIFAAKFIVIAAAIAAVVLLFEDLYTYLQGGDSLFGRFTQAAAEKFLQLHEKIQEIQKNIREGFTEFLADMREEFLLFVDKLPLINVNTNRTIQPGGETLPTRAGDVIDIPVPPAVNQTNQSMRGGDTNITINESGNAKLTAIEVGRRIGLRQSAIAPGINAPVLS